MRFCCSLLFVLVIALSPIIAEGAYMVELERPVLTNSMPLNKAIKLRRSVRTFAANKSLSNKQLATLLWAGQGVTASTKNFRTTPSAGAIYPLQLIVINDHGAWQYDASANQLELIVKGDLRDDLSQAAVGQSYLKNAAAIIVIIGDVNKLAKKYRERAERYLFLEAGHAAQNILLEATAMNLAATPVGAFSDKQIKGLLNLDADKIPLYLLPIGYKK